MSQPAPNALTAFFGGGQTPAKPAPNVNKELREKTEALEAGEKKLARAQTQLEKSLGALSNTKESLIANGEVVGSAMLSTSLEGYFGADKFTYGGVDVRALGGGALALFGVGKLLMGDTGGMHLLNAGVGFALPSLLDGARNAGRDLASRTGARNELPAAPARRQRLDANGKPVFDSTGQPVFEGEREEAMVRVPYDAMIPYPYANQFGAAFGATEPYPANPWQRGVNVQCNLQPMPGQPGHPAGFNGVPPGYGTPGYGTPGYPAPGQYGYPPPGYPNQGIGASPYPHPYAHAYHPNAPQPGFPNRGHGLTPEAPAQGLNVGMTPEAPPAPKREIVMPQTPAPAPAQTPAQVAGEGKGEGWIHLMP